MILVADSGASKTDWMLIKQRENGASFRHHFESTGLNPITYSQPYIQMIMNVDVAPITNDYEVEKIWFYGAGASDERSVNILRTCLHNILPKAEIIVEHDMLGAARALFGEQAGIAAILGTGSNVAYYDGQNVRQETPALGYVLGDEGSGSYIGKLFLRDYLYNNVPAAMRDAFEATYDLTRHDIVWKVYHSEQPNRFLASFAKFVGEHSEVSYSRELVGRAFEDFFRYHVSRYRAENVPISAVGSIAYHFQDILKEVCEASGFPFGRTLQHPISELAAYHLDRDKTAVTA